MAGGSSAPCARDEKMAGWGACNNTTYLEGHNITACISLGTACLTLVSCSFSVIGCLAIFIEFVLAKPKTASKWILVWISASDLILSAGYMFGTSFFINLRLDRSTSTILVPKHSYEDDPLFCHLCVAQSFITTVASMWSFFWTAILAIHLFLSVVVRNDKLSRRLMPAYHVITWTIGLVITTVVIIIGYLGTGQGRVSVSWCFIRLKDLRTTVAMEFVAGKFWEILSYLLLFILYIAMAIVLCKRKRRGVYQAEPPPFAVELKFVLIPVSFVFIRMWGTIRFFIGFQLLAPYIDKDKVYQQINNSFLVNMHALGDGGQGWVNALIFVVFSSRLLALYRSVCCWYCQRKKQTTHITFGGEEAARRRMRQRTRRIEETSRVLIPPERGSSGSSPRSHQGSPRSYHSRGYQNSPGGYGSLGWRNRSTLLGSSEHVTTPVQSDAEKH